MEQLSPPWTGCYHRRITGPEGSSVPGPDVLWPHVPLGVAGHAHVVEGVLKSVVAAKRPNARTWYQWLPGGCSGST
jgi:hypothetical protein